MDYSGRFSYFFRKYTLLRFVCLLAVIAVVVTAVFVIGFRNRPVPEIEAIVPPVGSPGDVVVIKGKNFGDARDMSYVEFAGSKLTASSYISWQDDTIKLVLPSNIQDGLVVVGVNNQRSKPALFANEVDIPVPVTESFHLQDFPSGDLPVFRAVRDHLVHAHGRFCFTSAEAIR